MTSIFFPFSQLSFFLASAIFFNSTIISNNLFYRSALASFLAPAVGQFESKWKLCHSALENEWDPIIFHRNCDNKNHTVTIIEKKPYIFGGYTDIPWGNSQFLFMYLSWTNRQIDVAMHLYSRSWMTSNCRNKKTKKKAKTKKKVAHHAAVRQVCQRSSYHILTSSTTF